MKTFDVTFQVPCHPVITMTLFAPSQRASDLDNSIRQAMDHPKNVQAAIMYVYEHKFSDMSPKQQGFAMAKDGYGIMENPFVTGHVQEPQATQWHEGFEKYHAENSWYNGDKPK